MPYLSRPPHVRLMSGIDEVAVFLMSGIDEVAVFVCDVEVLMYTARWGLVHLWAICSGRAPMPYLSRPPHVTLMPGIDEVAVFLMPGIDEVAVFVGDVEVLF